MNHLCKDCGPFRRITSSKFPKILEAENTVKLQEDTFAVANPKSKPLYIVLKVFDFIES